MSVWPASLSVQQICLSVCLSDQHLCLSNKSVCLSVSDQHLCLSNMSVCLSVCLTSISVWPASLSDQHVCLTSMSVCLSDQKSLSRNYKTLYILFPPGILGSTIINIRRMKQIKITVEENNQAFMTNTMEELKTIFQSDDGRTSRGNSTKPEKMSNLDLNSMKQILATEIRELKQELSEKRHLEVGQCSNLQDSSTFLDFERSLHDVSWWTKASVAASLASAVSCSLLLCSAFYRWNTKIFSK